MPGMITDGVFLDMANLPYLDFSQTYWSQQIVEETAIHGRLYLANGDITVTVINNVFCIAFNDTMRINLGLDDPRELVHAGTWTKDVLLAMSTGVYQDTDGSQTKSAGDTFGLQVSTANSTTPFVNAFALPITTLDETGYPQLTLYSEKAITALEFLHTALHQNQDVIFGGEGYCYFNPGNMFKEGRSLFIIIGFSNVKGLVEEMDDEFGIVPLPKYDENQESYYTGLGESNCLVGILSSTAAPDTTALMMEALAAENYRVVTPAIYEVNMKTRYASDPEMAAMFDLIRGGVLFSLGTMYGGALGGVNTFWKGVLNGTSPTWTSSWAAKEATYLKAIDEFYEKVAELPN